MLDDDNDDFVDDIVDASAKNDSLVPDIKLLVASTFENGSRDVSAVRSGCSASYETYLASVKPQVIVDLSDHRSIQQTVSKANVNGISAQASTSRVGEISKPVEFRSNLGINLPQQRQPHQTVVLSSSFQLSKPGKKFVEKKNYNNKGFGKFQKDWHNPQTRRKFPAEKERESLLPHEKHFVPYITYHRKSLLTSDEQRRYLSMMLNLQAFNKFRFKGNKAWFTQVEKDLQNEHAAFQEVVKSYLRYMWDFNRVKCHYTHRPRESTDYVMDLQRAKSSLVQRYPRLYRFSTQIVVSNPIAMLTDSATSDDELKFSECLLELGSLPRTFPPKLEKKAAVSISKDRIGTRYPPDHVHNKVDIDNDSNIDRLITKFGPQVVAPASTLKRLLGCGVAPKFGPNWSVIVTVRSVFVQGHRRMVVILSKPLSRPVLSNIEVGSIFYKYACRLEFIRPSHDPKKVDEYRRRRTVQRGRSKLLDDLLGPALTAESKVKPAVDKQEETTDSKEAFVDFGAYNEPMSNQAFGFGRQRSNVASNKSNKKTDDLSADEVNAAPTVKRELPHASYQVQAKVPKLEPRSPDLSFKEATSDSATGLTATSGAENADALVKEELPDTSYLVQMNVPKCESPKNLSLPSSREATSDPTGAMPSTVVPNSAVTLGASEVVSDSGVFSVKLENPLSSSDSEDDDDKMLRIAEEGEEIANAAAKVKIENPEPTQLHRSSRRLRSSQSNGDDGKLGDDDPPPTNKWWLKVASSDSEDETNDKPSNDLSSKPDSQQSENIRQDDVKVKATQDARDAVVNSESTTIKLPSISSTCKGDVSTAAKQSATVPDLSAERISPVKMEPKTSSESSPKSKQTVKPESSNNGPAIFPLDILAQLQDLQPQTSIKSETNTLSQGIEESSEYDIPSGLKGLLSYNLWSLGSLSILVRSKTHGKLISGDEGGNIERVIIAPKIEYACEFGGETLNLADRMNSWATLLLKHADFLLRPHLHPFSGEVLACEQLSLEKLATAVDSANQRHSFKVLKLILGQLTDLTEGTYLLRHKEGEPILSVFKPILDQSTDATVINALNLHTECKIDPWSKHTPTVGEFDDVYAPIDPYLILQYHRVLMQPPATFEARQENELPDLLGERSSDKKIRMVVRFAKNTSGIGGPIGPHIPPKPPKMEAKGDEEGNEKSDTSQRKKNRKRKFRGFKEAKLKKKLKNQVIVNKKLQFYVDHDKPCSTSVLGDES